LLCSKYKISFDSFADSFETIPFEYGRLNDFVGFASYLNDIMHDMEIIAQAPDKQIIYAAIDIPIFHHFNFPELSAFKMFYWMKAVVNIDYFADKKFAVSLVNQEFAAIGKRIYEIYSSIPSVEIWTQETINSLVKQIEFYWDSGNFASKEDAITICNQAKEEMILLEKQAEASNKKLDGKSSPDSSFTLFNSDIEIGNNCIYTRSGSNGKIYFSVHTFNKIKTSNKVFVEETRIWLENLTRKSNLISGVSQINRYKFFKTAMDKLDALIAKISN
jgi:hypothetical protein